MVSFYGCRVRPLVCRTVLALALSGTSGQAQLTPGQLPAPKKPVTRAPGQTSPDQANTGPVPESTPDSAPVDFESHGFHYQAVTKGGVTVMFAPLPAHVKNWEIIQIAVTNGSPVSWVIRPTDFTYTRVDGTALQPTSADEVVASLLDKAKRTDVVKLQLIYEQGIYSVSNYKSTNGYEQRREAAMTQFVNARFKAAAEASAITFVATKLKPGDSTDGAIFFEDRTRDKEHVLGEGRLTVRTAGETYDFDIYPEVKKR